MQDFQPFRRVRAAWLALAVALAGCENPRGSAPLATPGPGSRAEVPAQGTASTLDLGTWNLNSFGHESEGPSDEWLQLENVREVLAGADLDLWGVQEVVSERHFRELLSGLTGYDGFLASDPRVADGAKYYGNADGTEPKVGLVYKSEVAFVRAAQIILAEYGEEFAGRPPLEVQLSVSLNGVSEDVTVIVLHASAGTGAEDWERRRKASAVLESHLDSIDPGRPVAVIGDWSDDVDVSIIPDMESPYANFVADSLDNFLTGALSREGFVSTLDFPEMIDHHLVMREMQARYVAGSASVLRADEYVPEYGQTTSNHFPVLTRYAWGESSQISHAAAVGMLGSVVLRPGLTRLLSTRIPR